MIAVVTGASSGIGEAAARRLGREPGAQLVLVARREDRLRELARSIGPQTTYVAVDMTDDDAPARVRAHLEEHHGSTTPDPPGAPRSPTAAGRTSASTWSSTSTPRCA
jgi:NADP-dependent 3-hydroxy acid dehydrogenase YdfG